MASKGRLIGSAEFGVFEKRNNGSGEVDYESISTVNKPLKITPADVVRTIARKRIEVREVEDQDLDGDIFYKKNVKTKQIEEESDEGSNSSRSKGNKDRDMEDPSKPSALQVLKNFVDTIEARVTKHDGYMIAGALLLGASLIIGIVALIK
jgi:hypothetical protein